VLVLGAETPGVAHSASQNTVRVSFWGARSSGNQKYDLAAFGARSTANPPRISGTDNQVTIELNGVGKQIELAAVNSLPDDPGGTNTVTIIR